MCSIAGAAVEVCLIVVLNYEMVTSRVADPVMDIRTQQLVIKSQLYVLESYSTDKVNNKIKCIYNGQFIIEDSLMICKYLNLIPMYYW